MPAKNKYVPGQKMFFIYREQR